MAHNFGPLREQAAEDALHAERLLFIEERPFHRVTRRLLGDDSVLRNTPRQLPSPPPESAKDEETAPKEPDAVPFSREKFWEDVLIDFAALQSSITRIQLIHSSNERERQRYASEKEKILASAQAVRENTIVLREQLATAQQVLELRKGYDTLAAKILDDRKLKSREDARQDIAALDKEIEDLQAEGNEVEGLWTVRKEGFEKVVDAGQAYMRSIKGIKDSVEENDDEMDEDGVKIVSNIGTPRPDGSATPRIEVGNATPLPVLEGEDGDSEQHNPSKLSQIENAATDGPSQAEQANDVVMQDTQPDSATQTSREIVTDDAAETMDET